VINLEKALKASHFMEKKVTNQWSFYIASV